MRMAPVCTCAFPRSAVVCKHSVVPPGGAGGRGGERSGRCQTHAPKTGWPAARVSLGLTHKTRSRWDPFSRQADILHACDIMEDVAIAFGFDNVPRRFPPTNTMGQQLPVNKLSDLLRREVALAGYTEALTFALVRPASTLRRRHVPGANRRSGPRPVLAAAACPAVLPGRELQDDQSRG